MILVGKGFNAKMADYGGSYTISTDLNLPYSLEAEQSVLGAVLVESSCLFEALEALKPHHFYRPENSAIFDIMLRLFMASKPVDFVTVLEMMHQERVFDIDSDAKLYLAELIQIVPSVKNIGEYLRIVKEKYDIRSLIAAAREIIDDSQSGAADAQTLMDSAEQKIYDIRQDRDGTRLAKIDAVLLELYDKLQRLSGDDRDKYLGIKSGYAALDRILTGLNKSDLILLAARPAMGKTAFALNIATNVAIKANRKVAIFSLEMSREQLVERILSSGALVRGDKMRTGELSPEDWVKIAEAAQNIVKAPIYIDDSAGITVPEIKARLRRMKDVGIVIIDYLQLMSSAFRNENRVQAVSEITRSLKIMAKDLMVPVIVLSQLSRGPDGRQEHRPMLSDLRESGSIEQDADIVLFLYRDAYYNEQSEEKNVAECIIAKNRHGETGMIKLAWDGEHTRFMGLEPFKSDR